MTMLELTFGIDSRLTYTDGSGTTLTLPAKLSAQFGGTPPENHRQAAAASITNFIVALCFTHQLGADKRYREEIIFASSMLCGCCKKWFL